MHALLRPAAGTFLAGGSLLAACSADTASSPARPPNILLISLDTVRADHLSPYGYARDTTPTLGTLAREGTTFVHAFSQGNDSAYSHGAMLTGRYASELSRPVYETFGIPESATLVSEALQASGYETAMFSAGGHVTRDFGFDQGWGTYSAEPGYASLFDTGPKAAAWIRGRNPDQPWFAFLHSYDAHRPYTRPGPWDHVFATGEGSKLAEAICRNPCLSEMVLRDALLPELAPSLFRHRGSSLTVATEIYGRLAAAPAESVRVALTREDREHIVAHYDGALLYQDTLLGSTLAAAGPSPGNTVILVVSDHGEDLLDHGYMNHRTGLYDTCTRVPMVAWGPGFEPGARVPGLVEGRDIAATILAMSGVTPPAGSGGRDLRVVASGGSPVEAVFSEGVLDMIAVRTVRHRLVYRDASLADPDHVTKLGAEPLDSARFLLFDLDEDPGETTDIHQSDPTTTASLRDALVTWRLSIRTGDHVLPQESVAPAVAASLREHGYWAPEGGSPGVGAGVPVTAAAAVQPAPTTAAIPDPSCQDRFQFLDAPAP